MFAWPVQQAEVQAPMTSVQELYAYVGVGEEDAEMLTVWRMKFFSEYDSRRKCELITMTADEEGRMRTILADVNPDSSSFQATSESFPRLVEAVQIFEKKLRIEASNEAKIIERSFHVHRLGLLANQALIVARDAAIQELRETREDHQRKVNEMAAAYTALAAAKAATKEEMETMRKNHDRKEAQLELDNAALTSSIAFAEEKIAEGKRMHAELDEGYTALEADKAAADQKIAQGQLDHRSDMVKMQNMHREATQALEAQHSRALHRQDAEHKTALFERETPPNRFGDKRVPQVPSASSVTRGPPSGRSWYQLLSELLPAKRPARVSGDKAASPTTTRAEPAPRDTNPRELTAGASERGGAVAMARRPEGRAGALRFNFAILTKMVEIMFVCIVFWQIVLKLGGNGPSQAGGGGGL